jgi:folate-binding protein YgfZ
MGEADWERACITREWSELSSSVTEPACSDCNLHCLLLLLLQGCVPMGEADWERARITQGRPAAGSELTADYNPYEAGLCHAVSLDKGCYIGQETLAKVRDSLCYAAPASLISCYVLWGNAMTLPLASLPQEFLFKGTARQMRCFVRADSGAKFSWFQAAHLPCSVFRTKILVLDSRSVGDAYTRGT